MISHTDQIINNKKIKEREHPDKIKYEKLYTREYSK